MSTRDQVNRSQHRRAHQAASPSMRANARYWRAQAWSRTTGRPLPPSMRERAEPVSGAVPLGETDRTAAYMRQAGQRAGLEGIVHRLTPRQRRRITRKRNHQAAVRRRRKAAAP